MKRSGVKYVHIKHRLQAEIVQNCSKPICMWILMWEDNRVCTFSTGVRFYFSFFGLLARKTFNVKCFLMLDLFLTNRFSLHNTLTDGLESCGLVMFLSFVWTHFDGTHSLQRIHLWASDEISQNLLLWRNKLIYISDILRVSRFSVNFHLSELFI